MLKTIKYGLFAIKIARQANGFAVIFSIFCQIYTNTIFPFIQVFLLSKLLDLLALNPHLTFIDISWMIVTYLIASSIKLFLVNFLQTKDLVYTLNLNNYLELQINKKLASLDPAIFERPEFQNLIVQMDDVKHNIEDFLYRFVALVDSAFKALMAIVILLPAFPLFVPIILVSTLPSLFALNTFRAAIYPFLYEKRSTLARIQDYIHKLLVSDSTSKEIAVFKNESRLINKFHSFQQKFFKDFSKATDSTMHKVFLADLVQFVAFALTQSVNLAAVLARKLSIGQFSLYFQQALALSSGAELMLDHYSAANIRVKYLEKYEEFFKYPRQITSPKHPNPIPSHPTPPKIEFKNVSFRYPNTEKIILHNFNMVINSGEKIALVGENGAGKSTIIKLILRFFDVTEGEVMVNGVNVKDINLEEWHTHLGALFQDFVKYQFTVKENILFGDISKGEDPLLIHQALDDSGAENYIHNLPKGLDQVVGKMFEDGVDLSGGQWQKLALARAFFRNSPILILDEPTAAIDAKAEYEIFKRVQSLQKDKTVVIISHRFSTVRNADRILVLDGGKIIEEGNHQKLMKQKGLYAELFEIQAQGYK